MNVSIRTKLLAAFAVNLALMLLLGGLALLHMHTMNERARFVETITIPSLDAADKINAIITKYRSSQLEYIINNSAADKLRIEHEMAGLEQAMALQFGAYEQISQTTNNGAVLNQLKSAWSAYAATNQQHFLPSARMSNTGSVQPALNRMNPLYQTLVGAGQQLGQENQLDATEALGVVQASYRTGQTLIIADTLITLVISAAIGLLLSGRIANRIRRLSSATVVVATGDFDRTVDVVSRDELGVLAQNFNQMVASLRQQRAALEQHSIELAESLRRQQQLTDDLVLGKQAEEAAVRARSVAEAASQAKSMFLATMSHELRTPLTAILGYAQLLHMRAMRHQPDMVPELERLRLAGKHLLTIISNILDFSKIEQGRMDVDIDHFAVDVLVREAVALIEPLAQEQGNTISVSIAPSAGTMYSDPGKVRQILFNLLNNAVKFTDHGQIHVSVRREANQVVYAVADTGIGMHEEQLARLFQPFTQADASTTRKYGGTGLGLALSRQFARLLGGDIQVTSLSGTGSTFTLILPVSAPMPRDRSMPTLTFPTATLTPPLSV